MLQALSRRKGYHIDVITFTYQLFKKKCAQRYKYCWLG